MESLTKKIYKLMKTKHNGYAFIYDDFTNIGKYNAVRQSFSRLEKENKIKKIIAGMYYVPNYIPLIKEYEAPAVEEILKALSRKFGWAISANDEVILNKANLSNQVMAKCVYNTSGPNKVYKIKNMTITLIHKDDSDTFKMSNKSALIVKAIKIVGKNNLSDDQCKTLNKLLNTNERKNLVNESKNLPNWIKNQISKICN